MTAEFWITTAAIVVGPVVAVLVARWLNVSSDTTQRQRAVYRSLMATRRMPLSPQRVEALNVVDVEFAKNKTVLKKFKALNAVYNDLARWTSTDADVLTQVNQDTEDKFADLLSEMGKALGYPYESLDLMRGGYYPKAFETVERQQFDARELFASLGRGERALPVIVLEPKTTGDDR